MAQFSVHRNANPKTSKAVPYLLDVQSDLLESLVTRVVVPLILAKQFGLAAKKLNPSFEIDGEAVSMSTAEIAGVPVKALGEQVCSLGDWRDDIVAALDLLFYGI
ncbi:MAG: CcdB family protein [Burkholderiales bacterium]